MHRYPSEYANDGGVMLPSDRENLNTFSYSDGDDFEARIHQIIEEAGDRSLFSPELTSAIWDWRSSCHLSPVRANILRPLESVCRGRVLELGSGCGVITRYLGELGGDIVALEASLDRAKTTRMRTEDLSNVEVVCERIEDFDSEEKFDLVTMIGVLQYSRLFSSCTGNAEIELLKNAARQLKKDGVLVIAIQNKIGLKYLAGYPEPNVDLPYFGIEDNYGDHTIIRFGLQEIKQVLASVGLGYNEVLFPLPDYHMPVTVLTDKGLKNHNTFSAGDLFAITAGHDMRRSDWRRPNFSLERAWGTFHRCGLAGEVSNAFLVVAGKTPKSLEFRSGSGELGWHFSTGRHPAYATVKRFIQSDGGVRVLRSRIEGGGNAPLCPIVQHVSDEEYIYGKLWWSELVRIVNRPNWNVQQIWDWALQWIEALCDRADIPKTPRLNLDEELDGIFFDATPMNLIVDRSGKLSFFDLEWEVQQPLKLSFLILRGIFGSLTAITSCARPADGTPDKVVDVIRQALDISGYPVSDHMLHEFYEQEGRIQKWVNFGVDELPDSQWIYAVSEIKLQPRTIEAVCEKHLAEAADEIEILRSELHAIKQSRWWRATNFLRRLLGSSNDDHPANNYSKH